MAVTQRNSGGGWDSPHDPASGLRSISGVGPGISELGPSKTLTGPVLPHASGLKPPNPTERDPEAFTSDYVDWHHPRLDAVRSGLDERLSAVRGERARSGLPAIAEKLGVAANNPENKQSYRNTAAKNAALAQGMYDKGVAQDLPTTIGDIAGRYGRLMDQNVGRAAADRAAGLPHAVRRSEVVPQQKNPEKMTTKRWIEEDTPTDVETARKQGRTDAEMGGAGWYFDHRVLQASQMDPTAGLSTRQQTAMGGKLSALKTPADEARAIGGISHLVGSEASGTIDNRPISEIPSHSLAAYASQSAAWNAHRNESDKIPAPKTEEPQAGTKTTSRALVHAGVGHEDIVHTAIQIARGEITPQAAFTDKGFTPKTSAYSEMQTKSDPGTDIETDYRNIASHIQGIAHGTQSAGQGMLMFSQQHEGAPVPHALGSDTPTAIDTWMGAAGSGQVLKAQNPATGRGNVSPAKRLVDKDMTLDMNAPGKEVMGVAGTDKSVTSGAVVSAQHNEALRHLSQEQVGAVSHNQFGQAIFMPTSLPQEGVWTETRRQGGEDSEYSARTKLQETQQKQTATQATAQAKTAPEQLSLFAPLKQPKRGR